MKNIYFILILVIGYTGSAQDSRLFDNPWFLHEMFIEDIHFIPPTNNEIEYIPLYFTAPNSLETSACYVMNASVDFIGSGQFALFDGGMSLQGCENPENIEFGDYYMIDFWENNFDEIFDYSISVEGSRKILTILNASNGVTIYENVMLSTQSLDDSHFVIYPNPTRGILNIEAGVQIETIVIYDLFGRMILETFFKTNKAQMDLSSLKSGVYFVEIASEVKKTFQRIVKE